MTADKPAPNLATFFTARLAQQHPSLRRRCTVVNTLLRMAGGQCPLKGGQLTTTTAMGNWSIN